MIKFTLNNKPVIYKGEQNLILLKYLRNIEGIISVKDGCSGQAACGACMVEIDGKARLSCVTKMKSLEGKNVVTTEGIPENVRDIIAKAFVKKGAVQCGFCTPGIIMRTKVLFQENPDATRDEIAKVLRSNLCRCTGYIKIIDSIELALETLRNKKTIELNSRNGKIGSTYQKYQAYETAIGKRPFVNDLKFEGLLFAALKFSDHPKAKIKRIDISEAEKIKGVKKIFTAGDIPGQKKTGLIFNDWPLMIDTGETTHCISDVIAGVVAETEDLARKAADLIFVEYEILQAVTNSFDALNYGSSKVHAGRSNLLEKCVIKRGEPDKTFSTSSFFAEGSFETQRIEHAFLEPESGVALPKDGGIQLYSQGQGIYVDRRQVSQILNLPEENVEIVQVQSGGGFGGKEDLTVQGHVSLFAFLLQKPVKLTLSREESIRMHPKRHPVWMDMKIACNKNGKLTALKLRAVGDTGAYASVGTKVMERVAGHATGAYYVPDVDIEAKTVYTNNIPCGAMRGFGVNQVTFALESLIDELCEKGNFDRWKFRYDNALTKGLMTATGQILEGGVGIRKTLEAVKNEFYNAKFAGLACGIKNSGVGNGMPDESFVKIEIISPDKIIISHGWTEMGQGVHNMAIQTFCEETGISPEIVEVKVETSANLITGMTTSSRATALVGNAIIDACKKFKTDLSENLLKQLAGKTYLGKFVCDWTTKPGTKTGKVITHFAYGYATQLVVLNENGKIDKVYAAHDAGKIMNPGLFEGQIQGAVHMGLGYALTEDLPMKDGYLVSEKLRDCGILKANEMPEVVVKGIEVNDPVGPYGAKGIGEIGLVPTAAAVANAFYQFDGKRRYKLPLKRKVTNPVLKI